MNAKHALGRLRAPDESAAEERAWAVVRTVYPEILPAPRLRPQRRLVQGLVFCGAAVALVISSALASVRLLAPHKTVVRRVVAAAVSSLPAPGSVLISAPSGTWTMAANGSTRHLGAYPQATWSPHGEYVAVAGHGQLRAVTPRGRVVWTLRHPQISDPRWYSENGFRVAYLSGRQLRVVAGNGYADRALASGVAHVAPAWRPNHPYQLAYVTARGQLVIRDADSLAVHGRVTPPGRIKQVAWSNDGAHLLALTRLSAVVYGPGGRRLARFASSIPIVDGALSPDGRWLALVRGSDLILQPVKPGKLPRRLLAAAGLAQVAWSPDGHWLLVSWPPADEWLFVRVLGAPRIVALSHLREQFHQFPALEGWCCTSGGQPG